MSLRAGFAQIDITPPVGSRIAGWIREILCVEILDPLHARAAILESQGEKIAFIQMDVLSIRWTTVNRIRCLVSERFGYPGDRVMVCTAHNHAGPAMTAAGLVPRDDVFVESVVQKVVTVFGEALARMEDAEVGLGSTFEFDLGYNRRVVMRNGTVRTQATFDNPDALYIEGPMDPEVGVLAARTPKGEMLGCLVNFACHVTHHGVDGKMTAGFPGVFARIMREKGCPCAMFLNGAAGNVIFADPSNGGKSKSKEELGTMLATDALKVIEKMEFRKQLCLSSRMATTTLPFRKITEEEMTGKTRGAQRFAPDELYNKALPALAERIKEKGTQPAEVQIHFIDEYAFAAIPAEFFVQIGLRVKEGAYPIHAFVVAYANGMIGYVPHKEAFLRGGYETTFFRSNRLAHEAGDLLVEHALGLLRKDVQ